MEVKNWNIFVAMMDEELVLLTFYVSILIKHTKGNLSFCEIMKELITWIKKVNWSCLIILIVFSLKLFQLSQNTCRICNQQ